MFCKLKIASIVESLEKEWMFKKTIWEGLKLYEKEDQNSRQKNF